MPQVSCEPYVKSKRVYDELLTVNIYIYQFFNVRAKLQPNNWSVMHDTVKVLIYWISNMFKHYGNSGQITFYYHNNATHMWTYVVLTGYCRPPIIGLYFLELDKEDVPTLNYSLITAVSYFLEVDRRCTTSIIINLIYAHSHICGRYICGFNYICVQLAYIFSRF